MQDGTSLCIFTAHGVPTAEDLKIRYISDYPVSMLSDWVGISHQLPRYSCATGWSVMYDGRGELEKDHQVNCLTTSGSLGAVCHQCRPHVPSDVHSGSA